jgi:hypothetical protein
MLIDEHKCPTLIRAMDSKYVFGKTKIGEPRPRPEKTHPWSDIVDALQYAALCAQAGHYSVMVRDLSRRARRLSEQFGEARRRVTAKAWT